MLFADTFDRKGVWIFDNINVRKKGLALPENIVRLRCWMLTANWRNKIVTATICFSMENKTEQMQKRLIFGKPKEYQLNVI